MKTITFFVSFLFAIAVLQAQDYQISFTGSGQSTTIDSIQVENLTQGTTLSLNGDDVLHLVGTVGINILNADKNTVKVYPNPMVESAFVEFANSKTELVYLEIYNGMGVLITKQSKQVQQGRQRFEISGLKAGIYTVNVNAADWKYAAKLISLGKISGNTEIEHQGTAEGTTPENVLKSRNNLVQMQYNDGEMILFKGFAGNYARVLTLLPTQSQTVNFEFIPCSDEDGNNYAVVTIGAQTWMAENLMTTKYNNGNVIPIVTDGIEWNNLTTPAYCWYDNDEVTNKNTYGALYNWYTVNTNSLCPDNWHVPNDAEWTILYNYLGGISVAGVKMKNWGYWGSNESGFTGLPGGYRVYPSPPGEPEGSFWNLGFSGHWWASTAQSNANANNCTLVNNSQAADNYNLNKKSGISIRCLRD
jgi:uncharacterized protein (TIGR02145 family)